ncbi:2-phospho-L-lactate guanylyltransferase [Prauserella oleivorans]|uniref:Phosphoenolpyruvate guanylyltransferase n=1 Tax=Prauserella oleivorans TaxID=1478153 RepID=A0ABW5WC54_9PSEU
MAVDLIVPMKPPHAGKSRLRGVLGAPDRADCHAALVLALAEDTVAAALATPGVRRVVVVSGDPAALAVVRELGAELLAEDAPAGLNAALRAGERLVRADDPDAVVGALQADLPALRPAELAAATAEAGRRRAFAADRHGTGTTLLLSAPGEPLDPRFGPDSARDHARSGAVALGLTAPSLRADVDTPADLDHARLLGLGPRTTAILATTCALR